MTRRPSLAVILWIVLAVMASGPASAAEPLVLNVWPDAAPGESTPLPPEADQTMPEDRLIAGRRIIKLGNVSTPQIAVYRPDSGRSNGAAVVICPGGGHRILAYDLEGTEVAEWLNSLGVTGIVLKYRVPSRDPEGQRWLAAVQDAQRAMSLVRSHAEEWGLDPERIGICGFSAGGEVAALTSLLGERRYETVDDVDAHPSRPNFALLVYPGGLVEKDAPRLRDYVQATHETPPMFLVHAWDDRVTVQNSLLLASALKEAGVGAEVHLYATGGHGYGLRETSQAVTRWPVRATAWMQEQGFLKPR